MIGVLVVEWLLCAHLTCVALLAFVKGSLPLSMSFLQGAYLLVPGRTQESSGEHPEMRRKTFRKYLGIIREPNGNTSISRENEYIIKSVGSWECSKLLVRLLDQLGGSQLVWGWSTHLDHKAISCSACRDKRHTICEARWHPTNAWMTCSSDSPGPKSCCMEPTRCATSANVGSFQAAISTWRCCKAPIVRVRSSI